MHESICTHSACIVAKCPNFAGTVPIFRPLSQLCPGWHKIVPEFLSTLSLELQTVHGGPKENPIDVLF